MKLFHISQDENNGYDTYDSAVVCAQDADDARTIRPDEMGWCRRPRVWCSSPDKVEVKYLGEAAEGIKRGVVCASFNAG